MIHYNAIRYCCLLLLSAACLTACEKAVEIGLPNNQLPNQSVFNDNSTAGDAMNGVYERLLEVNGLFAGGSSITVSGSKSADELRGVYANANNPFETVSLSPSDPDVFGLWSSGYEFIWYCNSILEGVAASSRLSRQTMDQLNGEAKFVRAFCYFYLVNMFGDVPLVLTTDYRVSAAASRSSVDKVYEQIISDLTDAQALLPADYNVSGGERTRPNKMAVNAMLARVHLYRGDWSQAETLATSIIEDSRFGMPALDEAFLKGSNEAIWQLRPINTGVTANTWEGSFFIFTDMPTTYVMNTAFATSFEPGDGRATAWVGSITDGGGNIYYYPYKYKVLASLDQTEYSIVFRLAEQYLIRAEARYHADDLVGAIKDLDVVRGRAGLTPLADDLTGDEVKLAIEKERKFELFTEWGHRWLDLKRTGRADEVLGAVKGGLWQPMDKLYPIPQVERNNDHNLSQNDGYK